MQIDHQLDVADIRDRYLNWNSSQFNQLIEGAAENTSSIIQLLPLLLHTNNRSLPGFIGLDVPSGIYSYVPSKAALNEARLLSNKYKHYDEGVIKKSSIDAVYIQTSLIGRSQKVWVFISPILDSGQIRLLKDKIEKISTWLINRGVNLDIVCLTEAAFRDYPKYRKNENLAIYLDFFYSEIVVLAGKYPVWWLVPPEKNNEYEKFIEHIKRARFVEETEFLDLGSTSQLEKEDFLRYAVEQVKSIKNSAEICLIKLLVLNQKNVEWPGVDGVSIRLKKILYQSEDIVNATDILVDIMRDSFDQYHDANDKHKLDKIFSKLKNVPGEISHRLLNAYLDDTYYQEVTTYGLDNIISYLNLFKSIGDETRKIFLAVVESFEQAGVKDDSLLLLADNMRVFLSESSDRVQLYNIKDKNDIVFDRIQLKHEITDDNWSLILQETTGNEKTIGGFSCLLGLLAWCWLNRVVNRSTQVSINCPLQQVKQTEAFFVLETLMRNIDPKVLLNIPEEAFENPARPIQSMLFVNFTAEEKKKPFLFLENEDPLSFGNSSANLITHCEQLIINSMGDVYTRQYTGNIGVLECLCEWAHHAPVDGLSRPQRFEMFGHGTGESTHMAQRVNDVYKEMIEYFYQRNDDENRFILCLAADYYVVTVMEGLLQPAIIGNKKNLIDFLELPHANFVSSAIESRAYAEEPLRDIFQSNKENVLQVFFRVSNKSAYCWVLDEKGTLWRDLIENFDKDSFVTHWLYLFKNLRSRLKGFHSREGILPALEIKQISVNQLGGLEFYLVGADSISGVKNFIDVQVNIQGEEIDHLSLVCDGRKFEYTEFKTNALSECVNYLSSRMLISGRLPIYVTDVDVPLRLYNVLQSDELHFSHMLKLKRNFERRIKKMLGG